MKNIINFEEFLFVRKVSDPISEKVFKCTSTSDDEQVFKNFECRFYSYNQIVLGDENYRNPILTRYEDIIYNYANNVEIKSEPVLICEILFDELKKYRKPECDSLTHSKLSDDNYLFTDAEDILDDEDLGCNNDMRDTYLNNLNRLDQSHLDILKQKNPKLYLNLNTLKNDKNCFIGNLPGKCIENDKIEEFNLLLSKTFDYKCFITDLSLTSIPGYSNYIKNIIVPKIEDLQEIYDYLDMNYF